MSGHSENVKWLIRFHWIWLFVFFILCGVIIHQAQQFMLFEKAQVKDLISINEADRAQFKRDFKDVDKIYAKRQDIMPACFKGKR